MQKAKIKIDYDGTWKIVTTNLIEDFIKFFLPSLYIDIDFSYPPEFLEQELLEMVEDEKLKHILDKLVKLRLKNGEEKWIFVHIEFQTEGDIRARMFIYYRRILDKFGKEITAIVIYTGRGIPKKHDRYESDPKYGTGVIYFFNSYIIAKQKAENLLKDENPFSIVVLANLYLNQTHKDLEKRLEFKESLYSLAESRGYSFEKTSELFIFVKELMRLTPALEQEYNNFIVNQQKNKEVMRVVHQDTKDLINALAKNVYGKTVDEVYQEKDAVIIRAIINLRDKMNLSAEQIASMLGIDTEIVINVLSKLE